MFEFQVLANKAEGDAADDTVDGHAATLIKAEDGRRTGGGRAYGGRVAARKSSGGCPTLNHPTGGAHAQSCMGSSNLGTKIFKIMTC